MILMPAKMVAVTMKTRIRFANLILNLSAKTVQGILLKALWIIHLHAQHSLVITGMLYVKGKKMYAVSIMIVKLSVLVKGAYGVIMNLQVVLKAALIVMVNLWKAGENVRLRQGDSVVLLITRETARMCPVAFIVQ